MRPWRTAARVLSRAFDAVQQVYEETPLDDSAGRDAALRVMDGLVALMRENDAQLRVVLEERAAELR